MGKIKFNYNENSKIRFKIIDIIQISLSGLEAFLGGILENYPDSLNIIIQNLISQFEKIRDYQISFNSDHKILKEYPHLINKSMDVILSLVNFSKYQPKSIYEEIDIDVSDLIHTYYC